MSTPGAKRSNPALVSQTSPSSSSSATTLPQTSSHTNDTDPSKDSLQTSAFRKPAQTYSTQNQTQKQRTTSTRENTTADEDDALLDIELGDAQSPRSQSGGAHSGSIHKDSDTHKQPSSWKLFSWIGYGNGSNGGSVSIPSDQAEIKQKRAQEEQQRKLEQDEMLRKKFQEDRARVTSEALSIVERYTEEADFVRSVIDSIVGSDRAEFETLAARSLIYHAVFYGARPELREDSVGCIHLYIPSEKAVKNFDWKIKVTKEMRDQDQVVKHREEFVITFNVINHYTVLAGAVRTYMTYCSALDDSTRMRLKVLLNRIAGTFPEHYSREALRAKEVK